MKIKVAVCNKKTDKKYKNQEHEWDYLVDRNRNPIRTTETAEEYPKMSKVQRDNAKDIGGFVGGWLKGGIRKNGCVISRILGTLDADHIDDNDAFMLAVKTALVGVTYFLYSTHSHTPENPRYRIVILFAREVSEDEYPAVTRMIAKQIGMDYFDDSTYQANRMMYWASCPSNGQFVFDEQKIKPLDPDKYLGMYSDWRDVAEWPTSTRQSEVIKVKGKEQADPLQKDGIVGVFCCAYSISEVMLEFLSDVYAPTSNDNRFDYIPAESMAGVMVFDDKFVYSFHESDPACGKELNAFDLVRIHKFPSDDEKKSFKEMADFASKDEKVKLLILQEKQKNAQADFAADDDSWKKYLEYESRSTVLKNNLHNITLIMENDSNLRSIVFNQLADGMEIKGVVPWKHPAKFWRDADDAQLISYIDSNYGTFSERNYRIAVTKVSDDRSYHPIKEMFESLPPWDGVKRAETILIDYLGADDNDYVRAVTKKALCAAYMRVYNPGIKFDTMIVLNGAQGIGKSTLISLLGMDWFSDSLTLSDMNDKTAAEKLQGYWILEIGELAGMKKADLDKVKAFISRQDDKYRASFGRRVTPHPRQCVFFGTTNSENGYLRDITGNRRFWNVKVNGDGKYKPWELDSKTIKQIWAEVVQIAESGEKLYLDPKLETYAKREQRKAMEHDEREGLVREYLEILLPDNWVSMDIYSRREYLRDKDNPTHPVGTVRRETVSNMEIWCECFGKSKEDMRPSDSYAISALMVRVDGWERSTRLNRDPIYGRQRVYVRTDAWLC